MTTAAKDIMHLSMLSPTSYGEGGVMTSHVMKFSTQGLKSVINPHLTKVGMGRDLTMYFYF